MSITELDQNKKNININRLKEILLHYENNKLENSDNKNSYFTIKITERQTEIDHDQRQERSDLTRLKTLLCNYKDRIIANLYIKFPHLTITQIINDTNEAVSHLISGL